MFLVNSRHPLVCAPQLKLPLIEAPFFRSYGSNLQSSLTTVLSSALVYSTSPPVSVLVRPICRGYFQEVPGCPPHPIGANSFRPSSLICRLTNINVISIDYAFRPRLRYRLTLRGLPLRRKPWTFGGSVSHTPFRYSSQHSHFRYLQQPSRATFTGLRNALLPRTLLCIRSFGRWLNPRYIFGARYLDQ